MAFHALIRTSSQCLFMTLYARQLPWPICPCLNFFMSNISVTIHTLQFRFFNMEFMGNLYMMSSLHLLLSHCLMAEETVLIHPFICEKVTRKQSIGLSMAICTTHPGRVNLRRSPHWDTTLPCVAGKTDLGMGGQEMPHPNYKGHPEQSKKRTKEDNHPFRLQYPFYMTYPKWAPDFAKGFHPTPSSQAFEMKTNVSFQPSPPPMGSEFP